MKIGVLALQGDFAEHLAILQRLGAQAAEVRLPEQLDGLDGLIVPGGESTTISRLLRQWQLLEPIRERARAGMAVWGTCAGAILLAERASDLDREGLRLMDITVERNAFGRQVDSFEATLSVPRLGPEPLRAVFIRAPIISHVGAKAEALAHLAEGGIVAAQQEKLLATTFHPELTTDTRFHRYFLDLTANGRPVERKSISIPR
ncbi:MAG: pyridoxal 5'-phosphate synthase glutaminase subunit PdxT [Chloroflexi bacterium]|nr:pyridoxal 5'-phosphate synthase glutaminase subunit PdxT [Chloroflexota bacterium]